jgi:hypothetical protein
MSFPNRELSQFAYFLKVNDTNQKIAITTTATPFVGIGSTNPTEKLDVLGNIKSSGIVSAIAFYGDGANLDNIVAVVDGYFVSEPSGIWTGSNVGIGTSTFDHKLNVGGNVSANRFISYSPQGTAPFQVFSNTVVSNLNATFLNGRSAPSGNIVGTGDSQTLTNKTLINPIIPAILNDSAVLTLPTTSGILVHSNASGILTSGVYAPGSINNIHIPVGAGISYSKLNLTNTINNSDIAVGAAISYSKLSLSNTIRSSDIDPNNKIQNNKLVNSTISGVSLGSSFNQLIAGNYLNGNNYDGSSQITFDVDASTENVGGTLVARDSSGNIAGNGLFGTGKIQFTTDGGEYSSYLPPSGPPPDAIAAKMNFIVNSNPGVSGGDILSNGGSDGVWAFYNIARTANRTIAFALANESFSGYDTFFRMYRNSSNGSKNVDCPTPGTIFTVNGTKNFKITHPLNENKYLTHVSIEGPRADLIYRGTVILVNGNATVDLDKNYDLTLGTFNALCRNPQVWISNIDGWAHCKGKVDNGILIIEAREKNANEEVNWMIIAERQDSAMFNPGSDESGRPILETDKEP